MSMPSAPTSPAPDGTSTPSRPTSPPPPPPAPQRRLVRPRDDRVVAGVASGIARHLDLDPVLVRLAFVIVTLAGGAGVLAYLVGWLVIPEAAPGDEATTTPPATSAAADRAPAVRLVVGAVLVLVGTSWFVDQVVPGVGRVTWPLTLIALGLFVIAAGARR